MGLSGLWILLSTVGTRAEAPLVSQNGSGKEFPDIPARRFSFGYYQSPKNSTLDEIYAAEYNRAVRYYNVGSYERAARVLTRIFPKYDDEGKALYLLGMSLYYGKDYESALKYLHFAKDAGYDRTKAEQLIFQTLGAAGDHASESRDYRSAIGYYKAALEIKNDAAAGQNAISCYLQLAITTGSPADGYYLLYARDLIKARRLRGELLGIVANNLCNVILNPPRYDLFDPAILSIRDALTIGDDPFLHQSLGMIYLYQGQYRLAKAEFKKVITDYRQTKFFAACLERYREIGTALYHYRAGYPIRIGGDTAALASLQADVILQIPQSYAYQNVSNLQLLLNGKTVPFSTVTDSNGTKYVKLELNRGWQMGENELVVNAEITAETRRFKHQEFAGITLNDYRTGDPRYQLLIRGTQAADKADPEVQRIARRLRESAGSRQVVDLADAVYHYVIGKLTYRSNESLTGSVSVARALGEPSAAICEDYAILTVALLRALGIPASYYSGDTYGKSFGHAWAVFYTPDYRPVPLDPTWGDTSGAPDLYFLASSNLNLVRSFDYDSELMPGSTSIRMDTTSDPSLTTRLGEVNLTLTRLNE